MLLPGRAFQRRWQHEAAGSNTGIAVLAASHPRIYRYKAKYRSAMRSTVKRAETAARLAARSIWSMCAIASIAASRLSTRKPVTPSSISSRIDPRLRAMTGVVTVHSMSS